MGRAAVTLGYLDWLLRAFMVGCGLWIVLGAFSRFDQLAEQRQPVEQVSVVPSPSASPEVSPSPSPVELSPMAVEVSSWDVATITLWADFCEETRNAKGYGIKEQLICKALNEVSQ